MYITIPHGYEPGDEFPVYDASDAYLGVSRVPAGYYGGDRLEFYRSMLDTKKAARQGASMKQLRGAGDAVLSLALTVACIMLISKLVNWWRTRKRRARRPGADYPAVPSATDARDARRRQKDEENRRRAEAKASRDAAAQRAHREADARIRELRIMRKEEASSRKVWTTIRRGEAASLLAAVGRMRCARRLVAVTRAALIVQRASRFPGVIGLRRAMRKAFSCAAGALAAATRASDAADEAAEAADSHMCAWPLQRCFRTHRFRRGFYAVHVQRFCRVALARKRLVRLRWKAAKKRGRNAVVMWQRAWRARRPRARRRAAAALAGELLFAEEKSAYRKKRRETERKRKAREREKVRKRDGKEWLEKAAAANQAAETAADALWATLAQKEACAAILIAGARGPRADRVNGFYRACRQGGAAAPLLRQGVPPLRDEEGGHPGLGHRRLDGLRGRAGAGLGHVDDGGRRRSADGAPRLSGSGRERRFPAAVAHLRGGVDAHACGGRFCRSGVVRLLARI